MIEILHYLKAPKLCIPYYGVVQNLYHQPYEPEPIASRTCPSIGEPRLQRLCFGEARPVGSGTRGIGLQGSGTRSSNFERVKFPCLEFVAWGTSIRAVLVGRRLGFSDRLSAGTAAGFTFKFTPRPLPIPLATTTDLHS